MMVQALKDKTASIGVIGLGYVGLPLALELAKQYKVLGFDVDHERIEELKSAIDNSGEISNGAFLGRDIEFINDEERLKDVSFYIVAVPTPIDKSNVPDLSALKDASEIVGASISKANYVVYESTVYPGCTEELCIPIIEEHSGLVRSSDFKYGYSPERINPGDKNHTIDQVVKVVSGDSDVSLRVIADVYSSIVKVGVHKAPSVRVAEAAKVIENAQRDLNIAFMNELAMIFDRMEISTSEVLEAAKTKWNFLDFRPGLVGGHCIGVDPYYLTYKAEQLGYKPRVILSGRSINDEIPYYVARKLIQKLIAAGFNPASSRVLVRGITFKENVSDIRNSKVFDMISELESFGISVCVEDPNVDIKQLRPHVNVFRGALSEGEAFDAIVVAVAHDQFRRESLADVRSILKTDGVLFDLKGIYTPDNELDYWSL